MKPKKKTVYDEYIFETLRYVACSSMKTFVDVYKDRKDFILWKNGQRLRKRKIIGQPEESADLFETWTLITGNNNNRIKGLENIMKTSFDPYLDPEHDFDDLATFKTTRFKFCGTVDIQLDVTQFDDEDYYVTLSVPENTDLNFGKEINDTLTEFLKLKRPEIDNPGRERESMAHWIHVPYWIAVFEKQRRKRISDILIAGQHELDPSFDTGFIEKYIMEQSPNIRLDPVRKNDPLHHWYEELFG